MDIKGHIVRTLWIEHASDIATEYYASVLLDRSAKQPLVMFSTEGGVDIEEVAERTPEKLIRHHVDPLVGLPAPTGRADRPRRRRRRRRDRRRRRRAGRALRGWWPRRTHARRDQPADRHARPRESRRWTRRSRSTATRCSATPRTPASRDTANEDPLERRPRSEGVHYVKLDGDIGILGNGAGLVM